MGEPWTDLDPDERDFKARLSKSVLARQGDCPLPELLMAAQSGVLPEEAGAAVAAHLAHCRWCQAVVRDLGDPELTTPTPEEARRMRERIFRQIPQAQGKRTWLWRPLPVVATLAMAVVLATWIYTSRRSSREQASRSVAPPAAVALRLEKAPVKLPAVAALVWRGAEGGDQQAYVTELGEALVPYRADDYAEAARRLEPLLTSYPRAAEAPFYLGVCRLFLGRNSEAVAALKKARQLAEGALAQDAAWYLGIAYQRAGETGLAAGELEKQCNNLGEYQARACAGLEELRR